jgi:uncharacterized RDD family membrane protein YckC
MLGPAARAKPARPVWSASPSRRLGERRFARFWLRLVAGVIDWSIVFAGLWLAVILTALLGGDGGSGLWPVFSYGSILLVPLLYFGLTWARSGQTLGLRATDLQLVSTSAWEPPSRPRALLRALVAVLTFVACWLPPVAAFGDSSEAAAVIGVAVTLAVLALAGHLWALVDRHGQTLQDRLFGLAVLAERPSRT